METKILLVRHGQTEWNRVERFRGRFDVELNEHGVEQARRTAARINKNWHPDAIYSSPLKRAIETANIIARQCALETIPHKGLIDIDYGEWQGLTPLQVSEKWPKLFNTWINNPEKVRIPSGESLSVTRDRAMSFLSEITKIYGGKTIVLVSHTVVNRLIMLSILGTATSGFWRLGQDPCSVNLIKKDQEKYFLCFLNNTCHLD